MNNAAHGFPALSGTGNTGNPSLLERDWKARCRRGNQAFVLGNHAVAESHYVEAVSLARVAVGMAQRAGDAVPEEKLERWLSMWVIGHLNLSDLYARAEPERALGVAFSAYERMVECLHDARVAARVHRAFLRHLRHLLDGLMDLMKRTGIPEQCAARIRAKAQALALGYWNAWT
jgi:hypothetical protein